MEPLLALYHKVQGNTRQLNAAGAQKEYIISQHNHA
jgi:hypothetical protein